VSPTVAPANRNCHSNLTVNTDRPSPTSQNFVKTVCNLSARRQLVASDLSFSLFVAHTKFASSWRSPRPDADPFRHRGSLPARQFHQLCRLNCPHGHRGAVACRLHLKHLCVAMRPASRALSCHASAHRLRTAGLSSRIATAATREATLSSSANATLFVHRLFVLSSLSPACR